MSLTDLEGSRNWNPTEMPRRKFILDIAAKIPYLGNRCRLLYRNPTNLRRQQILQKDTGNCWLKALPKAFELEFLQIRDKILQKDCLFFIWKKCGKEILL